MVASDPYPEHSKLAAIKDQSQTCGEFLDWLRGKGWVLAQADPETGDLYQVHLNTESLLAECFEIDLDRLEQEKRAMVEVLRAGNPA